MALLIVVADSEGDAEAYARRVLEQDREVPARPSRRKSHQRDGAGATENSIALAVVVMIALAVIIGVALRWWLVH